MNIAGRRIFDIHVDGLEEPMRVISNPSQDDLLDARERAILKTWRKASFSRNNAVPSRHNLGNDLLDGLQAYLLDLEILPDGDLRYVSCGRVVAAAFGGDLTGRRTSELPTPVSKVFLSVYQLAIKHPMPFSTRHRSPLDTTIGHWHRLILPIDPVATGRPGRFLVSSLPIGERN